MKIGLIDVDGHHFPNLPLMKLSAWHKKQGDTVRWYDPFDGLAEEYDHVYMSKVFSFSPDYQYPIYAKNVTRGGSGYCISLVDGKEVYDKSRDKDLPYEIEHIYPDYSLYPEETKDTAYGFLTRGCPRGCSFCHVACKEGRRSYRVASLSEFWNGQKNLVLCDPNILACPEHMELLQEVIDSGCLVEFNQGLDIRFVNEENIELINSLRIKMIHFAFDRWQDKEIVESKLRFFREHSALGRNKIMVYILCNYDTTFDQDLYRVNLCRELDMQPYPMIYDKAHCDAKYRRLQRWCSPFIFQKVKTWEEYGNTRRGEKSNGKEKDV